MVAAVNHTRMRTLEFGGEPVQTELYLCSVYRATPRQEAIRAEDNGQHPEIERESTGYGGLERTNIRLSPLPSPNSLSNLAEKITRDYIWKHALYEDIRALTIAVMVI
jgi:hypothetical protein